MGRKAKEQMTEGTRRREGEGRRERD